MKKSVYSLVLMDEVIDAVDQMAYKMQTSRSNLINQLLAEKLAVTTPEMQMKHVFDTVEKLLQHYHHFQIQQQAADSMLSIRSVLKYKYNPTLRYAIVLNRDRESEIGEMRIVSRSQSEMLINHLNEFFGLWSRYEKKAKGVCWQQDQVGRWIRVLSAGSSHEEDKLASDIVTYVEAIDNALKLYFNHCNNMIICHELLQNHYLQAMKNIKSFN